MSDEEPIDYEAARARFAWIGLVDEEWGDLATRYREIMARARIDREAMDAVDMVRRSA